MEHYAGLDVSLELTSVCVVDGQGQVVREAKVASEPEALIGFLCRQDLEIARVGLEAGPLSQWIHAGLVAAGFETVLLETRHVKAALSAMTVKTDRRDARDIATDRSKHQRQENPGDLTPWPITEADIRPTSAMNSKRPLLAVDSATELSVACEESRQLPMSSFESKEGSII